MASLPQLSPLAHGGYPRGSPPSSGLSPPPPLLARQQGFAIPHEMRHHPYPEPPPRIMDPSKRIPGCTPFPVNSLPVESLVAPPDGLMYSNPSMMKLGEGIPLSMNPSMCVMPPYDIHGSYQYLSQAYASLDPRRKNATKESTNTLKAWLYEHKKNPYPTKGEKIMLAILTRMTLTQVSTWFANARRRLKKERGGWTGEDDDEEEDVEVEKDEDDDADEEVNLRLKGDIPNPAAATRTPSPPRLDVVPITPPPSPPSAAQDRLSAPSDRSSKPHTIDHRPDRNQPADQPPKKSSIWSIADMVQSSSSTGQEKRRDPTPPNVTVSSSWSARDFSHHPYAYPYASVVRRDNRHPHSVSTDPRLQHAYRHHGLIIQPSNQLR